MKRSIIAFGLFSLFIGLTIGCAADASTYEETSEEEFTVDGVRMVGIGGDGVEHASVANEPVSTGRSAASPKAPQAKCIGCGPLPDPWRNGPLPDPWTQPSNSHNSSTPDGAGKGRNRESGGHK